jgi:uncharacterized protein YcbK (DUF882 family)
MPADRSRRLSPRYVLGEFLVDTTFPELAQKLDPTPTQLSNLERLAAVIERINDQFPARWKVLSGYRDQVLNEACRQAGLPASLDSLHLEGCAADIEPHGGEFDLEAVYEWVRDTSKKDLDVHEAVFYPLKGFIHIGVEDPKRPTQKRVLMRT